MSADDVDRRAISFAEAEGKALYPNALNWGELDQRVRSALWNRFYLYFFDQIDDGEYSRSSFYNDPLSGILLREYVFRRHGFANEFEDSYLGKERCLAHWADFFRNTDYVELFDFITFFLRDGQCPKTLIDGVSTSLEQPWSPYRLIQNPPTIIPAVSQEEAFILKRDLDFSFASNFGGAKVHLKSALDALNKGDHRHVVRESINGVESAIRDFTGDPKALISKALKKLTEESNLHPALSAAFDKLYAYTSDENGIRHALVFGENENVGFDEAVFFVSACSAFIGLLSRKSRASE